MSCDIALWSGESALRKLQLEQSSGVGDFMSTVLSIHGKFHDMVREVFGAHRDFYDALDSVSGCGRGVGHGV